MSSTSISRYVIADHDVVLTDAPRESYVLRFRDLDDRDKPREKLIGQGPAALNAAELMAVVLNVGTVKEDVLSMARRVTREYGATAVTTEQNPTKLADALDIPLVKACQIVAAFELGRRYFSRKSGRPVHVRDSKAAYEYLRDMGTLRKEQLRALYLGSRYQIIHDEVISIGSLTANIAHPREVFQPAIEHGAVAVLIAHNHPSNHLEPSTADIDLTEQLKAAGTILGIDLIDHLIITSRGYVSVLRALG